MKLLALISGNYKSAHRLRWWAIGLGLIPLLLIVLPNHLLYKTAALDLGMFNHALFDFRSGRINYFITGARGLEINYFGDHFSPITALYSPLSWVFGHWTLLIVQLLSWAVGYWFLDRLALLYSRTTAFRIFLATLWWGSFAVWNAFSFDFHNNVVAAALMPILLYFFYTDNKRYWLIFALLLMAKENTAIWVGAFSFVLMLDHWRAPKGRVALWSLLFSLGYFLLVMGLIMPSFKVEGMHQQLDRFGLMGGSVTEILQTLITRPLYALQLLWTNGESTVINPIKSEFYIALLFSGGYVTLRKPRVLIILLALLVQKMWSSDSGLWGLNAHYSIEFVPTLAWAFVAAKPLFKKGASAAIGLAAVAVLFVNVNSIYKRSSVMYRQDKLDIFGAQHYRADINLEEVREMYTHIPKDAVISCTTNHIPRLAFRKRIYHYPHVKDATYIVLFTKVRGAWPLNKEKLAKSIDQHMAEGWTVEFQGEETLLLKHPE